MRHLITALLRTRPGRAAAAGLGVGALALTAGLSAAAPAMAATTHPATPAAPAAAASAGYAVQQVNPTTYINVLSKKVPEIPLREGDWIIRTHTCGTVCYEVTSEGLGILMTLQSSGFSTFNKSNPAGSQGTIYMTANGNYCVHADSAGGIVGSTACGAGNTASQFVTSAGDLLNVAYGGLIGQNGPGFNGENVLNEPLSGAYYDNPNNIG